MYWVFDEEQLLRAIDKYVESYPDESRERANNRVNHVVAFLKSSTVKDEGLSHDTQMERER